MPELEPEIRSPLLHSGSLSTWPHPSRYNRDNLAYSTQPSRVQQPRQRLSSLQSHDWIFFDSSALQGSKAGKHGAVRLLCLSKASEEDDTADQHCGHPAVKSLHVSHHPPAPWVSGTPCHRPSRESSHPCHCTFSSAWLCLQPTVGAGARQLTPTQGF